MNNLQGQKQLKNNHFIPFNLIDSSQLTPDNPSFFNFELNIAILTKYGRYIYIRHGNEQKCSSFFATLCTIVNKLQLSFGSQQQPAKLKKIRQGKLTFYALKRQNYLYICWTRLNYSQINIYSMIQFLHYQLRSSLTQKVNKILDQNQTYDPTVNFGKGRAIYNMLHYSIMNGLYCLPIIFGSIPSLPLKINIRNQIFNYLKESKQQQQGILVNIIMTMSHIISIWKRKGVDFTHWDFLLLCNLLQTNSTLCKSQNWFPICLPGVDGETMIFCYLNFITKDIIHVMISDQSDKFPELSSISKNTKIHMTQTNNIQNSIQYSLSTTLKSDPSLQRSNMFHHFIVYSLQFNQLIQSSGNNFGYNVIPDYLKYIYTYGQLYEYYLKTNHNRKQKLHTQTIKEFIAGYYEDGQVLIMFIMSNIMDLQETKSVISSILKYVKEEEQNLFFNFPK